jgi:hypothetical protein
LRKKRSWFGRTRALAKKSVRYIEEVPGSLKGHLNREELVRVSLTAVTAGGGLFGLLQAISLSAGTIFPAPTDAALAAAVLTAILEVLRRLGHGNESARTPLTLRTMHRNGTGINHKEASQSKDRQSRERATQVRSPARNALQDD